MQSVRMRCPWELQAECISHVVATISGIMSKVRAYTALAGSSGHYSWDNFGPTKCGHSFCLSSCQLVWMSSDGLSWSSKSVCTALGHYKQNKVATISGIIFSCEATL